MSEKKNSANIVETAIKSIAFTAQSLTKLTEQFPPNFKKIVKLLFDCKGKVIVTGIGKSALIAQKITATFNSTGTVAAYLHAADALHGDLGMVQSKDIILALSKSGNTPEIVNLCQYAQQNNTPTVVMTSNSLSELSKIANFTLHLPLEREADPNNLAPTTSSCLQLVMGDALALCLAQMRGFKAQDFGKIHPAGSLGKLLHLTLADLYIKNQKPSVPLQANLQELIIEISQKRMGATAVLNKNEELAGIITDGDLRRMLEKNTPFHDIQAQNIMNPSPLCLPSNTLAHQALQFMENKHISQLLVVENGKHKQYLGMVHLHDLIKLGIEQ